MAKSAVIKENKNVHEGHRDRLRQRFLEEGLENFQDHNVIELLLFYSIPRKDTNEEAHRLMDKFGSLSGVFNAGYDELCQVKGISDNSATLIKMMPELFKKYEVDIIKNDDVILDKCELIAKYVSSFFKGVTTEKMYLLSLDSACRVISFNLISEGIVNATPLNIRKIMEISIKNNAAQLILIHNHPSGIVAPSRNDVDATMGIQNIMTKLGMKLGDHIIIGHGDDFFSFRKSDKWKYIFQ